LTFVLFDARHIKPDDFFFVFLRTTGGELQGVEDAEEDGLEDSEDDGEDEGDEE
jgi:hypothetical protein